ncbi:four helix bundle protein [Acidaminococcus massiliensis]|jgi:four helix bundle protein|uniref:four helix bundle protein n=1 Tax=Acidaminococcus massiliensis TaxID=1852375 RepID=UPI00349F9F2E
MAARGSCAELDTQFILSYILVVLSEEEMREGTARCPEISNKLTKLAASLN